MRVYSGVLSFVAFFSIFGASAYGSDFNSASNGRQAELASIGDYLAKKKYVYLSVDLRVDNSLQSISKEGVSEISRAQDDFLDSIGDGYIRGAVWKSLLGPINLYVDAYGFERLKEHPAVRALSFAQDNGEIYDPENKLPEIERVIEAQGSLTLSVVPQYSKVNSDSANRREEFDGSRQSMEALNKQFLASLNAENFEVLDLVYENESDASWRGYFSPGARAVLIRAKIEGFYELKNRKDVLSIRPLEGSLESTVDEQMNRKAKLDYSAIEQARENGRASVSIHLKRWPAYTPQASRLSQFEYKIQDERIRSAFQEIINEVQPSSRDSLQFIDGIASAIVQLDYEAIKKLYANPDLRIDQIDANKVSAYSALSVSTANGPGGMNAQHIWKYTRAARQWVAILDSGVELSHAMFARKSFREGCFATDNSSHYSPCPSKNSYGDTPPSYELYAGRFCGYVAHPTPSFDGEHDCSHGTHVAGIAAGRGGYHWQWGALNGVAIDANVIAVNMMSRARIGYSTAAYDQDIIKALQFIVDLNKTNYYPITVNMSVSALKSSVASYGQNCDQVSPAVTDLVLQLKSRQIAVVASTGNNGIKGGIGYPACISHVVKVSSVNKYTGILSNFSNVGHPLNYVGQMFLAPGGEIVSARPTGSYAALSGTSMAAPHVTGAIALIKEAAPAASVDDVNIFLATTYSTSIGVPINGQTVYVRNLKFN